MSRAVVLLLFQYPEEEISIVNFKFKKTKNLFEKYYDRGKLTVFLSYIHIVNPYKYIYELYLYIISITLYTEK